MNYTRIADGTGHNTATKIMTAVRRLELEQHTRVSTYIRGGVLISITITVLPDDSVIATGIYTPVTEG